ncbi:MAG: hypothetical protein ABJR23_18050, partial [Paracoccaceae bacterium]
EEQIALDALRAQLAGLETDVVATIAFASQQQAETKQLSVEITARETRLAELKGLVANAEAVKSETEVMRAELTDATTRRDTAQKTLAEVTQEIETARATLAQIAAEIDSSGAELSAVRDELGGLETQVEDANATIQRSAEFRAELGVVETALSDTKARKSGAEAELATVSAELNQTRAELDASNTELQAMTARMTESTEKAAQAENAVTAAKVNLASLKSETEAMRTDLKTLTDARTDLQAVSSDLALITVQRETAKTELAQVEAALAASKRAGKEAAATLDTQDKELADTRQKLAAVEAAIDVATRSENAARQAATEFESLVRGRDSVSVELEGLTAELTETRAAVEAAEADLKAGLSAAATAQAEIDEIETHRSTLMQQVTEKDEEVAQQTAEIRNRRDVLADLNAEIAQTHSVFEEDQAQFEADRAAHSAELAALAAKLLDGAEAEERLTGLAENEATLLETLSDLAQRRDATMADLEALEAAASGAEDARRASLAESELLAANLSETRELLATAEGELINIEQGKTTRLEELNALDAELAVMRINAEQARADFEKLTRVLTGIGSDEAALVSSAVVMTDDVEPASATVPEATAEDGPQVSAPVVVRSREQTLSRQKIRAILATTPGLTNAAPADLASLTAELERGACPVDALNTVFGSVNRQTLVALVRGMGTC